MTTMNQLHELITLKQRADTLDGLDAYLRALYTAAYTWTEGIGGATSAQAALHYDGLIDRLARDTTGTEQPVERSHTPEHDQVDTSGPGRPERLTEKRRASA